jgi:tetratricopeptide (TPR) repeat protein
MFCKKLFLFFALFFGILSKIDAQNQDVLDSLFNAMQKLRDDSVKVNVLNQIAQEYQASQPLIAHEYAQRALYTAEQNNYKRGTAEAYLQIAGSYYYQGNLLKDSEYLLKALPICEKFQDSIKIAKIYGYLGSVYEAQKDYEKQISYFQQALKIAKSVKDKHFIATLLSNGLGNAYKQHGNIERALMYHYEGLKMREQLNDTKGLADSYLFLGQTYMAKQDYEKATYYFDKSLVTNTELNNKHGLALTYLQMGKVGYDQQKYTEAAELFDKSLQIAQEATLTPDVKVACDYLSKTHEKLENYKKSYAYLSRAVAINDSLNDEDSKKKIAELQATFELQQQAKQAELQEAERERKNNLQYSGIFFGAIFLFVCVFIFGKFNIAESFVEKMLFFAFLLCFEFILLLTDPYVDTVTQREPLFTLLANAIIALFILPAHQYLEGKLKSKWLRNYNSRMENNVRNTAVDAAQGEARLIP